MSRRSETNAELLDAAALEAHPQFASTLANGLAVLSCFGPGALILGNKEITEKLQLTRPTVSRLTFTLTGLGFLRSDRKTGKYSLGPAVLSLGYPLLSQLSIRRVAAPAMLELARLAHGPVSIGMRDRLQLVYVETVQGQETSHTKPDIGTTRPLLRTAMGRALLYLHESDERVRILKRLREMNPAEWKAWRPALDQSVRDIDARGYCLSWGDWDPTLVSAAVPVQSPVHGARIAFSLTVPTYSVERDYFERKLAPRLVNLVRNVEYQLGLHEH